MGVKETDLLRTKIAYLKGVGPKRAELLQQEKGIFTFGDLIQDFPFRYIDKSHTLRISQIRAGDEIVQIKGRLVQLYQEGEGRKKRLKGLIEDGSGTLELVWFKGVKWLIKSLETGGEYLVYGRVNYFKGRKSIAHPEMEKLTTDKVKSHKFDPVYSSTEKLSKVGLDSRGIRKLMGSLLEQLRPVDLSENIPEYVLSKTKMCGRFNAYHWIHFPPDKQRMVKAIQRLKFEELFLIQLRLIARRMLRKQNVSSYALGELGKHFHTFYQDHLPFELTDAQKKVLREIRQDVKHGMQMNRLLQGDVGSGKTIVALMTMLMAIDNGYQACLMAPTEILARQHFASLDEMLEGMPVKIALLTGSIKGKERRRILEELESGEIHILTGTHAVLEDPVIFKNLGMAITDEQHRFGVAQRARLWAKAQPYPPHVLVMTATPIPRTLAMTFYGDLDVSVIDELPPGRKPIATKHIRDAQRPELIKFIRKQIELGRQIYVVFPLIEESASLDLQNLQDGYEELLQHFPRPRYQVGVVHGRMKPEDKDFEMERFASGKSQILVSTTVIEVGVNVPNATVMVIENAERFGLSQLHQLRGRVGRGGDQSYCLLVTGHKVSKEARERLKIMCETNDGFRIAEADLKQRGPGDIEGTRQSGELDFKLANLATDGRILQSARSIAKIILDDDPNLEKQIHQNLKYHLSRMDRQKGMWSKIG